MIGIYCITNTENGKKYIGQSINIQKRVKEHFYKANLDKDISYNSAIHQAIRKYGNEKFIIEVLEECSFEELDIKEQFYIKEKNSLVPNGYNIMAGGQQIRAIPTLCRKCGYQISKNTKNELCQSCYSVAQRTVERPSKEELIMLLKNGNFCSVGKLFGVSDNAIRKWCRQYGLSTSSRDYK